MTELLTAAQMRGIEQAAIASGAVTGRDLMERAGPGRGGGGSGGMAGPGPCGNPARGGSVRAGQQRRRRVCRGAPVESRAGVAGRGLALWRSRPAAGGCAGELRSVVRDRRGLGPLGRPMRLCATPWIGRRRISLVDAVFGTGLSREVALPLAAYGPRDGRINPMPSRDRARSRLMFPRVIVNGVRRSLSWLQRGTVFRGPDRHLPPPEAGPCFAGGAAGLWQDRCCRYWLGGC